MTKEDLYMFWTCAMVGKGGKQSQTKKNNKLLLVGKIHVVKINSSEQFAAMPHPSLSQRENGLLRVRVRHDV